MRTSNRQNPMKLPKAKSFWARSGITYIAPAVPISAKAVMGSISFFMNLKRLSSTSHTATGTSPTPGRTIAADPNTLPYGTKVLINGHEYIVEDCGGAIKGNRIDVLVDTHAEALQLGIYETEIYEVIK